jgi:xanthosine phosphorylase
VTLGELLPLSFGLDDGDAGSCARRQSAADVVRARLSGFVPRVGLILGSGLGAIAEAIQDALTIDYAELPGFPRPGVEGHAGRLVLGRLAGLPVACLQGRVHLYEGVPAGAVNVLPRTLKAAIGPRFPDMTEVYDRDLRARARAVAARLRIPLRAGVYLATLGPSFETPAEIRAFRALGAELAGMSTVPEAISARHCGLKVLGFSIVTNLAAGLAEGPLSHEETLARAAKAAERLRRLLEGLLKELAYDGRDST